jgi:hypothetical protein
VGHHLWENHAPIRAEVQAAGGDQATRAFTAAMDMEKIDVAAIEQRGAAWNYQPVSGLIIDKRRSE